MDVEREHSKGGLFNLFDWNSKSRMKLFPNNSELPEGPIQIKENAGNVSLSRIHVIEADNSPMNSRNKENSDFSCALSVTGDDGYGTRAPGVVARLMGLDSLPTSNVVEPSSTKFLDFGLTRERHDKKSTLSLWKEYNSMEYLIVPSMQDNHSRNNVESRVYKIANQPTERYKTENLPLKSAKLISIAHHKRPPFKTPGPFTTKNVTYIVEAAPKKIEASPKATSSDKVQRAVSSASVPLRIRDLQRKMKAENAAYGPWRSSNTCSSSKSTQGKQSGRVCRVLEAAPSQRKPLRSPDKVASNSLQNKIKSVSLVPQTKPSNIQRRGGSILSGGGVTKPKEHNHIKSSKSLKSHVPVESCVPKQARSRIGSVLAQNNQKQNCVTSKESLTSKRSALKKQGTEVDSLNSSVGSNRTGNTVIVKPESASKRVVSVVLTDSAKKVKKMIAQKTPSLNGDPQAGNVRFDRDGRCERCDVSVNVVADNVQSGRDLISCTFTSPIKKAVSNLEPSGQMMEKSSILASIGNGDDDSNGDSWDIFLQQPTNKVESSDCLMIREDTIVTSPFTLRSDESKEPASSVECVTESFEAESCADFSDSASSVCASKFVPQFKHPIDQELDYVRSIINSRKLEDFMVGRTDNSKLLFECLEIQWNKMANNEAEEEYTKLTRKIQFDCAIECLDLIYGDINRGANCNVRASLPTLLRRKELVVEEIYKELLNWKSMGIGELMIDELVKNDISTKYGTWLHFNGEAFEEGVVIEESIFSCLVDEVVFDLI